MSKPCVIYGNSMKDSELDVLRSFIKSLKLLASEYSPNMESSNITVPKSFSKHCITCSDYLANNISYEFSKRTLYNTPGENHLHVEVIKNRKI